MASQKHPLEKLIDYMTAGSSDFDHYARADAVEKVAKKFKAISREGAIALVEDAGGVLVTDEASGKVLTRVANQPDLKALNEVLKEAGIDPSEVYDEVVAVKFNPSKLERLVTLGKVDGGQLEGLHSRTTALSAKLLKE